MEQLSDSARTTIKQVGLCKTACIEWESTSVADKPWPILKVYFIEAYEAHLHSGAGTMNQNEYHGQRWKKTPKSYTFRPQG